MSDHRTAGSGRLGYWWLAVGLVLVAAAVVAAGGVSVRWWQMQSTGETAVGERLTEFPAIDTSVLDPTQAGMVAVLEREFGRPGDGPNYAEGIREPWCADFVSWVLREAGRPLADPNSGSWRIPGVYTLQEYYESTDRFVPADAQYRPRTGDVLLYGNGSPFGQHTNFVLEVDGAVVTTIGGNEFDEVAIHRFTAAEVPGFVGYGRL